MSKFKANSDLELHQGKRPANVIVFIKEGTECVPSFTDVHANYVTANFNSWSIVINAGFFERNFSKV